MVRQLRLYASHTAKGMRAHSAGSRIEAEYIPPSSGTQERLRAARDLDASMEQNPRCAPTTVVTNPEMRRNT